MSSRDDSRTEGGRARLLALPDPTSLARLAEDAYERMTLRESALYIAGYVAGFDAAAKEDDP